jgi:outer membrane protein
LVFGAASWASREGTGEVKEDRTRKKQGALKVKKTCVYAALAAAFLATMGAPLAHAQQQFVGGVAIIDLSYIFKNHERFKAMTEGMRGEVLRAEEALKARRTDIETLTKRLTDLGNELRKDSPEYKQLDADLTRKKIDLSTQVSQQKKEFLEKEAKIYYHVYQEVLDEVQHFAERNRISLVLRFNGDPVTDSDPQEILKQLNKQVVYYNKGIDITPHILDSLNRRGAGAAGAPGHQGVPATGARPGVGVPLQPRR